MSRDLQQALQWTNEGNGHFARALSGCSDDAAMSEPTQLAGWTRKHVVAHVAANSDALRNLVRWARTGEESRMYSSPQQRNEDIAAGAKKPAVELVAWFERGRDELATDLDALTDGQWQREVVTAQGRTVPANEIPWMRAREVNIHAVDVGTSVGFGDLSEGFLLELIGEIVAKRSKEGSGPALHLAAGGRRWDVDGTGDPAHVDGPLADVAAYLAGRPHRLEAPDLPSWL